MPRAETEREARMNRYRRDAERLKIVRESVTAAPRKGSGGYKNISVWLVNRMARSIANPVVGMEMSAALAGARWLRNELYEWIISYVQREMYEGQGFEEFKSDWRIFRVWCPLQVRLAVEEILWQLGPPYRKLITGFAPID